MKHLLLIVIKITLLVWYVNAQNFIRISGYVVDSSSNESLIGVNIFNNDTKNGTVTNSFGYFCINIPLQNNSLTFSYVGYSSKIIGFYNKSDTIVNVLLNTNNTIEEVVISNSNSNRLQSPQTSLEIISAKTVNSLPVIMGESDLTRTILLLPGVSSGVENSSGYFVRGGNSDQNLLLIDGVPIYNAYHLFGFFSVFNTDAINNAKLYKGDMPARYGGRLSSILDIQMKEGNNQKYSGGINLGMVSSKFLIEGPIKKGKSSFLITGRRSMMDIFPRKLFYILTSFNGMDKTKRDIELPFYNFYDLSAKINHKFSDRSRLFFSFYQGEDNFTEENKLHNYLNIKKWGNLTSSIRWNYLFSSNLFMNLTLYRSKYNYYTQNEIYNNDSSNAGSNLFNSIKYYSGILDNSAKIDFDYNILNNNLKFGAQYVSQFVQPGVNSFHQSSTNSDYNIDTNYNFNKKTQNGIAYIEDSFKPFNKISFNIGLHFEGYFTDNKLYKFLHPRISCNYQFMRNMALKGSYSRMVQNLHQLTNNSLGGPADLWVPSTNDVKPAYSEQFVFGIEHSYNNLLTTTVEVFYKNMYNLIAYKEGSSYLLENSDWQKMIEKGIGKSKGVEFSINKEIGRTTGWISYTYSKSIRKFENINFGKEFPFTYDRRNNFSIAIMHKFNERYSIGADWIYYTGHYATIANSYIYNELNNRGGYFKYINSVNNYRMPSYHRLDVSLNYKKSIKRFKYAIDIGVYNVYNRYNPYLLIDSNERIFIEYLFPILPYISCSVKF